MVSNKFLNALGKIFAVESGISNHIQNQKPGIISIVEYKDIARACTG